MTCSHCPHCGKRIEGSELLHSVRRMFAKLQDEFPGFQYTNAYRDAGGYYEGLAYHGQAMLCNRSARQVREMLHALAEADSRRKPPLPPEASQAPTLGQAPE